jgi:hypothetical protein
MRHETCFLCRRPLRIFKHPGISNTSLAQEFPHTLPSSVRPYYAEQPYPTTQGLQIGRNIGRSAQDVLPILTRKDRHWRLRRYALNRPPQVDVTHDVPDHQDSRVT